MSPDSPLTPPQTAQPPRDKQPQYQLIAEQLTASIQSGEYQVNAILPTLAELSDRFGVSQITARHAVRLLVEKRLVTTVPGKGTVVLPRSVNAASDAASRTRRVGLLAPFFLEWADLYFALPNAFHELGLDFLARPLPVEVDFSAEPDASRAQLAFLRENCGHGLLVFGDRFLVQTLLDTRQNDDVFVCLENFNGLPDGVPLVTTDNFGGTWTLTRHLIAYGHKRIAYYRQLREEASNDARLAPGTTSALRYAGYCDAMASLSAQTGTPLYHKVLPTHWVRSDTDTNALVDLFHSPNGDAPTAVVCASAQAAFTLWRRLKQIGLRVPDDVSLVTYDNVLPPKGDPQLSALTTLDQNFSEIAAQAVRLLQSERARLRDGGRAAPHLLVPPTLIERHSVAPPRH